MSKSTKHTPQIRLAAARRALDDARGACPHWDYESDSETRQECCYRVDDARRELRTAIAKAKGE